MGAKLDNNILNTFKNTFIAGGADDTGNTPHNLVKELISALLLILAIMRVFSTLPFLPWDRFMI